MIPNTASITVRKYILKCFKSILKMIKHYKNNADTRNIYVVLMYEILYVFDSLINGSTIKYDDEKHDYILRLTDFVIRYMSVEVENEVQE